MDTISVLQKARYEFKPVLPEILTKPASEIQLETSTLSLPPRDEQKVREFYKETIGKPAVTFTKGENPAASKKRRCGVLLSGGQAPGGHNVLAGLFDGLTAANPDSELVGFHGGAAGLLNGDYEILTKEKIDFHRNTGGFDIIGSGRTKIETAEQIEATIKTVQALNLDSLVIVGGDDSNTNAALLAEIFAQKQVPVQVIGVPKTIDGDLKNDHIETSFGFDTSTKVYASLIGDLARDTKSSGKYWNFVKLMGRSASHIALECALQIHPNICLIGEEIKAKNMSLKRILYDICQIIARRAENGENFGVILIPEGIVEFIPETANLIAELNRNWKEYEHVFTALTTLELKKKWLVTKLSPEAYHTLDQLPAELAEQFLGLRDPHGNILVSQIEIEKLFIILIRDYLEGMTGAGTYKGTFAPIAEFYGYEGRSAFPSNFDATYCYALGLTAFELIANGANGYLACVKNLARPSTEWSAGGVPLTMMMNMEERKGEWVPVIAKSLVDLNGAAFNEFAKNRDRWAIETCYQHPGPVQYFGPDELCNRITETLRLESEEKSRFEAWSNIAVKR
ncbi:MAG: diphosphate--fructose-6-phosphate 1-phosphotransferase [Treponema sp.]|nr:diphosphate--fructose-6-phosphate 1-phosphotransferase [Treponema sp.]